MPERQYRTLTKRTVDSLEVNGKDAVFWDRALPGFGIRVYPSGIKVYVVQSRAKGKSKRVTVGRHGEIPPERARKEAARLIAAIKAGEPLTGKSAGTAPTVADLAERYLREHVAIHTKPSTASNYRVALRNHIVPALGGLEVAAVERRHVLALQFALSGKPSSANRVLDMLAKMFALAELWEMRRPGRNPCKSVRRYKAAHKERFLTPEELGRLGRALDAAPAERLAPRYAAEAIRLLALTGCRRNEILELRWEDVDTGAGELRLRDSKTGPRSVPLPPAAAEVLAALPRVSGNPWVFPGRNKSAHLVNINEAWDRIRKHARLDGVRLHDLRHTYASRALALGESLPTIGELLGHRKVRTTARYAHLARDTVKASTAKVAESIGADILE